MFSGLNGSLLSYLSTQGQGSASVKAGASGQAEASGGKASTAAISPAALQRAAGANKAATATRALEAGQKTLSTDLRAALGKAGVKLSGAVEFTVKSDGSVDIKGSDADKAATRAFLSADTSQPSFATRIANQAREALKLSASIQQSAAISQAAKLAKSSGGVMSLYTSLMQQAGTASVVFSVSGTASSLTYPGSLTAAA
jgi:hypothetical protein